MTLDEIKPEVTKVLAKGPKTYDNQIGYMFYNVNKGTNVFFFNWIIEYDNYAIEMELELKRFINDEIDLIPLETP